MLKLKHIPIKSFSESVAYIHKDCSIYKVDSIKSMNRIEIHGGKEPVYVFLQIVDNNKIVSPDELGLNTEAFKLINLPEGSKVSLTLTPPAVSLASVKRKIAGNILSSKEYKSIIDDITARRYSNMDIASFLVAVGAFITPTEILSLTESLRGDKVVSWSEEEIVVDSCCFCEVPGNKADIIVAAIVAAYGLPIPKTLSLPSNSYSSLADVMSIFANINVDIRSFKKQVHEKRGAISLLDSLDIVQADKIICSVEQLNGLSTQERMITSLLASKIAVGVTHLLIDIPVGPKVKIKTTQEAMKLRKLIEYVGDMLSLSVDVVVTDGSEPIGAGVGSVLEARDIMKILKNKEDAPEDLKEKALFLAGRLLETDPKLRGGQGYLVAKEILKTGKALEAMNQIIEAQGVKEPTQAGHLTRDIIADTSGRVKKIDNSFINKISIIAGSGQYAGAGIDLFKKVGDGVSAGDILYRIYSCNQNDFAFVSSIVETGRSGFEIL